MDFLHYALKRLTGKYAFFVPILWYIANDVLKYPKWVIFSTLIGMLVHIVEHFYRAYKREQALLDNFSSPDFSRRDDSYRMHH